MPLQPGDVAAMATLPEIARSAIAADLERQQNAMRERREREQADAAAAEASRLAHPVNQAILAENARRAAQPPRGPTPAGRGGPAPAPAGMSALDARSYARSPALQTIAAFNDRDAASAQARQAAEAVARVERLEAQAAAMQAAAQAEEVRAAAVARTHQLERAIVAMAEAWIKKHPEI